MVQSGPMVKLLPRHVRGQICALSRRLLAAERDGRRECISVRGKMTICSCEMSSRNALEQEYAPIAHPLRWSGFPEISSLSKRPCQSLRARCFERVLRHLEDRYSDESDGRSDRPRCVGATVSAFAPGSTARPREKARSAQPALVRRGGVQPAKSWP